MKLPDFHIEIPTYDNGTWTETVFDDLLDFRTYILSMFKEPGKYDLDETSSLFNEQARNFRSNGDVYEMFAYNSKDFRNYWDLEKKKNKNGCIFKNKGKEWYLPRDYYFWINFLPIYDKIKKDYDFPLVWDVQLHIALYELLAELHFMHAAVFKKRQIASSYFHAAKLLNRLWFDRGAILKMGASHKDFIGMEGTWKFLEEYRTFLNDKTAWYRPMNPGKIFNWVQQIEVKKNGRKTFRGLKGRLTAMSFEQSPTRGVGGACSIFFYEESGVAPTLNKTYIYMRSALEMGELTTGLFIAAGSVGELKDAESLKSLINDPKSNRIYPVETDLIDDKGTRGLRGLFIPEQWGMPPYIDESGNSLVQEALEALDRRFAQAKKDMDPESYQLEVSQHPRNIKEGFDHRDESKFPIPLVEHQEREIEDRQYPYEGIELDESVSGEIVVKRSDKAPITVWPVQKTLENKEGVIQVWERPDKDIKWGTYVAAIDPVAEGRTITSESLCSIYVYKLPTHVKRYKEDGIVENFIEGDKIVACWTGRFDDINQTHKRLRLILEWYKAQAVVENNISLFISYMIEQRKQQYLVSKNQILFLKELQANNTVFQEYGWKNTGRLFKDHLLNYLIEFLKEVVEEEIDDLGVIKKKYYCIRRIPDIMAMKEMKGYREGVNVDRLVALSSLIAYVKILQANMNRPERIENERANNLENNKNLYKLKSDGFRNLGKSRGGNLSSNRDRSPFKRLR